MSMTPIPQINHFINQYHSPFLPPTFLIRRKMTKISTQHTRTRQLVLIEFKS